MRLLKGEYTISLNDNEAKEIVVSINRGLKISIKEHYNRLQQDKDGEGIFFEQSTSKLKILELMCSLTDWPVKEYIDEYKDMFSKRRKERKEKISSAA